MTEKKKSLSRLISDATVLSGKLAVIAKSLETEAVDIIPLISEMKKREDEFNTCIKDKRPLPESLVKTIRCFKDRLNTVMDWSEKVTILTENMDDTWGEAFDYYRSKYGN